MSDDVRSEPSRTGTRCPPPRKVHYPESNGLPIAETRFQYDSLTYAAGALDIYFQDRPDVAVEGFRLLYYVEGDPRSRVAPDVFVVFGAPKRRRRTYLFVGGAEGSGLRAGGDLQDHPMDRSGLQA